MENVEEEKCKKYSIINVENILQKRKIMNVNLQLECVSYLLFLSETHNLVFLLFSFSVHEAGKCARYINDVLKKKNEIQYLKTINKNEKHISRYRYLLIS